MPDKDFWLLKKREMQEKGLLEKQKRKPKRET